jgi:YD repeat-containing protein
MFNQLTCRMAPYLFAVMAAVVLTPIASAVAYQESDNHQNYYPNASINRFKDFQSNHFAETVEPRYGKLNLKLMTVYVPGPGGLDIEVNHTYVNPDPAYIQQTVRVSTVPFVYGVGWEVNFWRVSGSLECLTWDPRNGDNAYASLSQLPVLHHPDGRRETFYYTQSTATVQHVPGTWATQTGWVYDCQSEKILAPNGWKLTGDPALKWQLGATRIEDRDGNWINIAYGTDVGAFPIALAGFDPGGMHAPPIASVTASDGRSVAFNYGFVNKVDETNGSVNRLVLKKIVGANNQVWEFDYDRYLPKQLPANYQFPRALLKKVTRPDATAWRFDYYDNTSLVGDACRTTPKSWSMKSITYPEGGTVALDYATVGTHLYVCPELVGTGQPGKLGSPVMGVSSKINTTGTNVGTTTFAYSDQDTSVTTPSRITTFRYVSEKPAFGLGYTAGRNTQTAVYARGAGNTLGALLHKEDFEWSDEGPSNDNMILRQPDPVTDANNQPDVFMRWMTYKSKRTVTRAGKAYVSTYASPYIAVSPSLRCAFASPVMTSAQGERSMSTTHTFEEFTHNVTSTNVMKFCKVKSETHTENGTQLGTMSRQFNPTTTRVTSETEYGVTKVYSYTAVGDVASVTDGRGYITRYSDYFRGVPRTEKHPVNGVDAASDSSAISITRTVDDSGHVTSETDGEGAVTSFAYDGLHRVTSVTFPRLAAGAVGKSLTMDYTPTKEKVVRGAYAVTTTYDGFRRPLNINEEGDVTTMTYDSEGRRTFVSYPDKSVGMSYARDGLGRITSVTTPLATGTGTATKSIAYDDANNTVNITNERGYVESLVYQSHGDPNQGWLTGINMPLAGSNVSIVRHGTGKIASATQGGVIRSNAYDASNGFALVAENTPELGCVRYTRDKHGNMLTREVGQAGFTSAALCASLQNGSGNTTFAYDGQNRITSVTFPSVPGMSAASNIAYEYDRNGRVRQVNNGAATLAYVFDENKNLTKETLTVDGRSFAMNYSYDSLDHLNTATYPSGQVVTYTPSARGRATEATPFVKGVTYFSSGLPKNITFGNNIKSSYAENSRQWIDTLKVTKGTTDQLGLAYSYDAIGNLTAIVDSVASTVNHSRTMSFDELDRLSTVLGGDLGAKRTFSYDDRNNLTGMSVTGGGATSYTYDASNRLASVSGLTSRSFAYDVYGNVKANGASTFSYDPNANLRKSTGGSNADYDYDANQHRVKETRAGQSKYFFYSSSGKLLGEYDTTTSRREYFYLGNSMVAHKNFGALPF